MILIRELGDAPAPRVPLKKVDINHYEGSFQVDGNSYRFRAIDVEWAKERWTIEFELVDEGGYRKQNITGTGNASIIFSTATEYLKDFIRMEKPDKFSFLADLHEPSRVKLYDFFSTHIQRAIPYKIESIELGMHYKTYIFSKK